MKFLLTFFFQRCKWCGITDAHRAQSRGFAEQRLLRIFGVAPFRCNLCDFRYYAFAWRLASRSPRRSISGSGSASIYPRHAKITIRQRSAAD
jgi:hypothetical protein